ncbi:MAG TPA: choline dehydrogenase [Acetobacteraceae bacterium]|jgi:choline dehydrogenase|nr:choline dehydrogenase [Acetobacteraceae bacterium]
MATDDESFDYIVTGAGSAGCAVAARLSESGHYRVLLLEAGGRDTNPWIHIPMGFYKVYADPRVNWMFESEPEPRLDNRTLYQPRGKVLGGTSSINGMVYMRGNAGDYDEWRQRGCEGWDYDSVLPYFRKAEDQQRGANEFHGVGGPLRVSDQPRRDELADRLVEAAIQAGLPPNDDFNGARQEGAGYFQSTTGQSRRWSTATAYLRPARNRANLVVRPNCHATRIVIENSRATGVTYLHGGTPRTARARAEVIVSGGVYGSPQLLQLSGIGPAELLQGLGIETILDLPAVGEHLQDHFFVRLAYRCTKPITMNELANSLPRRVMAMARYVLFRSGPLAANAVIAGAFARSDPRLERPDLQFNFTPWSYATRDRTGAMPHPFPGFSLSAVHLRPDARGTVHLKSPDPLAPPAIRFNFLETPYDLQALTAGMRLARTFTRQPALAPYVAEEIVPGPNINTDAEFAASIRRTASSNLHPVGTCRMGPNGDAVVDARLRVHGIGRLRVADAAIMPTVPAGNTNAPSIMIGEKAADMILSDARAA